MKVQVYPHHGQNSPKAACTLAGRNLNRVGFSWRPILVLKDARLGAAALLLALLLPSFSGQPQFSFDIIARTGATTPAGSTITALGYGPSINDAGRVAYKVQIADGRQGIFVSGEPSARSSLIDTFPVEGYTFSGLAQNFHFDDVVQINNRNEIAWRVWSRDGLFSFVFRLGLSASDFRVVSKILYDRIDTPWVDMPSPFSGPFPYPWTGLHPWVTLNNAGRTVFSGILADTTDHTLLATPRDPEDSGHDSQADFYLSPPLHNVTNFFPQIADTGATVVRGGRPSTSPIMLFADPTLSVDTATFIATSTDFDTLGERPGISDDGRVVAFMAAHKTQDVGIYCAVINANNELLSGPFKITGFPGFSAFIEKARVGVNRSTLESTTRYSIAYLAFGESGTPGQPGPLGLYVTSVDITKPDNPVLSPPVRVVRAGDTIPGLTEPVQAIAVYDPINSHGQLTFWLTTAGTQAIVKSTLLPTIKGSIRFWDGIPMRQVRVSLLDANGVERTFATSANDGSYSITLPPGLAPGKHYLVATTTNSKASRFAAEGLLPGHDGEAQNWYTDGASGPHAWDTYRDPYLTPDLEIVTDSTGLPQIVGGDAYADYTRNSSDIYFPQPIVWVHGIYTDARRFYRHYEFFSNPRNYYTTPPQQRQGAAPTAGGRRVVDCSLSYFVDTLHTEDPKRLKMLGRSNFTCEENADIMETDYMRTVYDTGLRNLVAAFGDGPEYRPRFHVVCHSMGAPISRIWACKHNTDNVHGSIGSYVSISGIHGGNYAASQYTYRIPAAILTLDRSAQSCTVRYAEESSLAFTRAEYGNMRFAWGVHGNPPLGFVWRELEPHDGINNAPSAASQNGPYRAWSLGPLDFSELFRADLHRDLRVKPFGQQVRSVAEAWRTRHAGQQLTRDNMLLAYVDLMTIAEKEGLGDHSFMDSGSGCMASYALWLGLQPDKAISKLYQPTEDFATWEGDHYVPLAPQILGQQDNPGASSEPETLVASYSDVVLQPLQSNEFLIRIDSCAEATFRVVWYDESQVSVTLVDPAGGVIEKVRRKTRGTVHNDEAESSPVENAGWEYGMTNPVPGTWKVVVAAPDDAPTAGTPVVVLATARSDLVLLGRLSQHELSSGESVAIQAMIARNGIPITTPVMVEATVLRPDDTSVRLDLFDDGLHSDGEGEDGLYGATFSGASAPGEYLVEVSSQGVDDTGNEFQRSGIATFDVMSGKGTLMGDVQEAAVDTDNDGLYEELQVAVGVVLTQPGTFLLSGNLERANGLFIAGASTNLQLGVGSHTIVLRFDATALSGRRVSGPYQVVDISLGEVAIVSVRTSGLRRVLPCDRLAHGILTLPYSFWEFDRSSDLPLLVAGQLRPGHGFEFILSARRGFRYSMQASVNLVSWDEVTTVSGNGVMRIIDPSANEFRHRFYRAVRLP